MTLIFKWLRHRKLWSFTTDWDLPGLVVCTKHCEYSISHMYSPTISFNTKNMVCGRHYSSLAYLPNALGRKTEKKKERWYIGLSSNTFHLQLVFSKNKTQRDQEQSLYFKICLTKWRESKPIQWVCVTLRGIMHNLGRLNNIIPFTSI